jgi:hypothetical protein
MHTLLCVTREAACTSICPAHVPSLSIVWKYSSNGTSSSIKGSNVSWLSIKMLITGSRPFNVQEFFLKKRGELTWKASIIIENLRCDMYS